jgi:hypothetical protein
MKNNKRQLSVELNKDLFMTLKLHVVKQEITMVEYIKQLLENNLKEISK